MKQQPTYQQHIIAPASGGEVFKSQEQLRAQDEDLVVGSQECSHYRHYQGYLPIFQILMRSLWAHYVFF